MQVPENILTNWTLTPVAPQISTATLQDQTSNLLISVQVMPGQALQGTQLLSQLTFQATTNRVSSFISLPLINVIGLKPTGSPYSNYVLQAGSVTVVEDQPLLLGSVSRTKGRSLVLYGKVGTNYQVQYKTNLADPGWQLLLNYTQTNSTMNVGLGATNPLIFYRVMQQ